MSKLPSGKKKLKSNPKDKQTNPFILKLITSTFCRASIVNSVELHMLEVNVRGMNTKIINKILIHNHGPPGLAV